MRTDEVREKKNRLLKSFAVSVKPGGEADPSQFIEWMARQVSTRMVQHQV